MKLVTVESEGLQETLVNPDQVTYLRHDTFGTAIHFASGEHIICSLEMDELKARLANA